MQRKKVLLILIVIVIVIFPLYGIMWTIVNSQNSEEIKQVDELLKQHPSLEEVTQKLGEPKCIFDSDQYAVVRYKNISCSNSGLVSVWDTKNWYGKGIVLVISFKKDKKSFDVVGYSG